MSGAMTPGAAVVRVDAHAPDAATIERAAAVIRSGGLVAFPTETVYGLGANALDATAVAGTDERTGLRHHWGHLGRAASRWSSPMRPGFDATGGDMALSIGVAAPNFTLTSHDGRQISLGQFRGARNVVLAFFPLAWTPI